MVCMGYQWKSLVWIGNFQKGHLKDQGLPTTTYRARTAVASTSCKTTTTEDLKQSLVEHHRNFQLISFLELVEPTLLFGVCYSGRAKPTIDYTSNAVNRILVFQFYFNVWKGVLKHLHFFDFLFSLITCMATESRLIRNAIFIFIIPILIENQNTNNRASSRWQITHSFKLTTLPFNI